MASAADHVLAFGEREAGHRENLTTKEPNPWRAQFLAIARILKPQGRRGEVLAEILSDFPARFQGLRQAFLGNGNWPSAPLGVEPVAIENAWPHKGRMVLKFTGVDSITQAERLAGLHVLIRGEERMPLPPHHYYLWELRGCHVVTERQGVRREVGTVAEVEATGGVDLLRVSRHDGRHGDVLIPLAQAICTRIDPEERIIVIDPPQDLLELNDTAG